MIGFFRKIRKKLADDNKPLKYMRYAVGEILLVVVGILIALQINNLNEKQKQKSTRDAYYIDMINNFDSDLEKIDLYLDYVQGSTENIDQFKSSVRSAESYKEASQYIDSLNYVTTDVDLNASIWKSLINSGEVKLLDESIKKSLLAFWNRYDDYYESDFTTKQHYWDLVKGFAFFESGSNFYTRNILRENKELFAEAENSRNYFEEVNACLFAFAFREAGNRNSKYRLRQLKKEIKEIQSAMQKELENK